MVTQTHDSPKKKHDAHPFDEFIISRSRLTIALILIALGGVFLLQQAHVLGNSSNWWVIFIAIPGFVSLGSAVLSFAEAGKANSASSGQAFIGVVLLVLSAIFIWDPTWSFTRGWQLDRTFPFLRNMGTLWPWLLVIAGAVFLFMALRQKSKALAGTGVVLCVVGAVFIFDVSWNLVWPLVLVAMGVWLLVKNKVQV